MVPQSNSLFVIRDGRIFPAEDGSQRGSSYGDDSNFEQLMVNMLDERDRLMESLRETQDALSGADMRIGELERVV